MSNSQYLNISGLPRSMPNADPCRWMSIKILALIPMSINADQCRSMPINSYQCRIKQNWCFTGALIRHWSAMIGIERHFRSMPWFWSALIGIGHWLGESWYMSLCKLVGNITFLVKIKFSRLLIDSGPINLRGIVTGMSSLNNYQPRSFQGA